MAIDDINTTFGTSSKEDRLAGGLTITARGQVIVATAPRAIRGKIEARGIGILNARVRSACRLALVVDLDRIEGDRLPPLRTRTLLGVELPLLHSVERPHFPAAILQYLKAGRSA